MSASTRSPMQEAMSDSMQRDSCATEVEKQDGRLREVDDKEDTSSRNVRPTTKQVFSAFVESTTLHGIRFVFAERPLWARLAWLCLLLAASSAMLFTTFGAVRKYYSFPVHTVLQRVHDSVEFPAVTICPSHTLSRAKLNMGDNDRRFQEQGLKLKACEATAHVRGSRPCGLALLCCCADIPLYDFTPQLPHCSWNYRNDLRRALNESRLLFNMEEFYRQYGQEKLSVSLCRLGTQKCSSSDFKPIVTRRGICYTFNVQDSIHRFSRLLILVVDLKLEEHAFGEAYQGSKIIVHSPGEYISRTKGFNVGPGTDASVGLAPVKYINLPPPYPSKCVNKRLKSFQVYTIDGCRQECFCSLIVKKCGCRQPGCRGDPSVRVCSMTDVPCMNKVEGDFDRANCNCEAPCSTIHYETSVSYSKFPDSAFKHFLIEKTGANVSNSLVLLYIFFESWGYELQQETVSYNIGSMLGEIGGNVGLFLGCSVLTLVEFLDVLISVIVAKRRKNDHSVGHS